MENGFVIGLPQRPVILAEAEEVMLIAAFFNKIAEETGGIFVVEEAVVLVPLVNNAPPCSPSVDAEGCGKKVVAGHAGRCFVVVGSRNHADAGVVFVAVEHFLTEGKERLRGRVVVFEHNALVDNRKGPLLRHVIGGVASVVFCLVHTVYVTLPVDVFVGHNLPAGFHACAVAFVPCAVLIKKKVRRARLFYLFKHQFQGFGAVEKKYQNRDVGLVRLFHAVEFSVCAKLAYFLYTAESRLPFSCIAGFCLVDFCRFGPVLRLG